MPRSHIPCGQPKFNSTPSAPTSAERFTNSYQRSRVSTISEAITARSGQWFFTSAISRKFVSGERSLINSILLKPTIRVVPKFNAEYLDETLTIGSPIVNVSSRYSALNLGTTRMVGFNNIELISDRSPETNFREIAEVKNHWPDRAVIASLMVDTRERWYEFVKRSADVGADGVELNFGCPHGMCERGMGSAVGQRPEVTEKIVSWVMEAATIPVIVKLTPNITDVVYAARAARKGAGNAIFS